MAANKKKCTPANQTTRYIDLTTGKIRSKRGSSDHVHKCSEDFQTAKELIAELNLSNAQHMKLVTAMLSAGKLEELKEIERLTDQVLVNLREAGVQMPMEDMNSETIKDIVTVHWSREQKGSLQAPHVRPAAVCRRKMAENTVILSDYSGRKPVAVLAANSESCDEKMIIWYIAVAVAAIFAIFTVLGLKMKGGRKQTQKAAKNIMKNKRTRKALIRLTNKCDGKTLYQLMSEMWDTGLLGKTIKECADFGFGGAAIFLIGLAVDFIPGAGEIKVTLQCTAAAGGVAIAIAEKPEC